MTLSVCFALLAFEGVVFAQEPTATGVVTDTTGAVAWGCTGVAMCVVFEDDA